MPKSRRRKKKPLPKVGIGKRVVDMPPQLKQAMREQLDAFVKKFGREPGPNDPVFFDPDADTPQEWDPKKFAGEMKAALLAADLPPQIIYAYEKTGMLLLAEDLPNCSPDQQEEWEDAIDEYFALQEFDAKKGNPN